MYTLTKHANSFLLCQEATGRQLVFERAEEFPDLAQSFGWKGRDTDVTEAHVYLLCIADGVTEHRGEPLDAYFDDCEG